MTGTEFVRQVMSRLEVTTAAGLAEKMRWKRGTERTVARWLTGDSEPSFDYTIDMAIKAGMLTLDQPALSAPTSLLDPDLEDRLARLGVAEEKILQNQEDAFPVLEEIRDGLRALHEELEPSRSASPASPKRRGNQR